MWEGSSVIPTLLHTLGLPRRQNYFWLQREWEEPPQQGK